jgi:hypothetical protein
MGQKYTKRVTENLSNEEYTDRLLLLISPKRDFTKFHFIHESAFEWSIKDIIIDGKSRIKRFKKILGKENAGIVGNEYTLFNHKYSLWKRICIGDKLTIVIEDLVTCDYHTVNYTVNSQETTITHLLLHIGTERDKLVDMNPI